MPSAVRDAKRSNAKRSTAHARDTSTTHTQHVSAQHYSAHNTVHIQGKVCAVSTARFCVHSRAIFARVILSCVCVPRVRRFLVVFLLTETAGMFSEDTAFQHALSSVPSQLLTAIKGSALDQPGVLVAYIEGVLEDGTEGGDITGPGISFSYCYRYRIYGLFLFHLFVFSPSSASSAPLFLPRVTLPWYTVEANRGTHPLQERRKNTRRKERMEDWSGGG